MIRDKAIEVEETDIESALKLMSHASRLRPGGPLIQRKLREYLKKKASHH